MKNETVSRTDAAEIRHRAEARLKKTQMEQKENDAPSLSAAEAQRLIQELQIHQIELEMQQEELLRAQEELESSRARYFDLYDLAPVGYVTISAQEIITEANLTAATLLNVARGELVDQPVTRFILPEDQDTYYQHKKTLMETGESQKCELRMQKKNGPPFWALLRIVQARAADGAFFCRSVISNISDRKKAESQRESALEEIKILNEDLERKVIERTAELQQTIRQLEELNRIFVGRELKMAELKERIAELEKQKSVKRG